MTEKEKVYTANLEKENNKLVDKVIALNKENDELREENASLKLTDCRYLFNTVTDLKDKLENRELALTIACETIKDMCPPLFISGTYGSSQVKDKAYFIEEADRRIVYDKVIKGELIPVSIAKKAEKMRDDFEIELRKGIVDAITNLATTGQITLADGAETQGYLITTKELDKILKGEY